MMQIIKIQNFRRGLATNSSSTHSIVYQKREDLLKDLNVFEFDYYGRCTDTVAATKEAKLKYILAGVWYNDELVKLLSVRYPEIKQYFPLVKKAHERVEEYGYVDDDVFGMYARGRLDIEKHPMFTYEYLCHVIDSDDLAIVGGSDEQDFCYDNTTNRVGYPIAEGVDWHFDYPFNKSTVYKNGNYYVAYGGLSTTSRRYCENNGERLGEERLPYKYCDSGRLRFTLDDRAPIPEYPELIDLCITNKCQHGCPFCFMDSKMRNEEANFDELRCFINALKVPTEFAVGGGNVLLYPKFVELVELLDSKNHIVNVTINVKDCKKILDDERLLHTFRTHIDGVGISVFNEDDAKTAVAFIEKVDEKNKSEKDPNKRHPLYSCLHIIPEYIGYKATAQILEVIDYKKTNRFINYLYLGYKENGRGKDCKHHTFSKEELYNLMHGEILSVDTTFAQRYLKYLDDTFDLDLTVTLNEGEFSMYVDGTTMTAYKSSHDTDKGYYVGYDLKTDWKDRKQGIRYEEAFARIREDNGFPRFEERYWDL